MVRLLLLWLMAIVVPVKGLAAASMIGCAARHDAAIGATAPHQHHHAAHAGMAPSAATHAAHNHGSAPHGHEASTVTADSPDAQAVATAQPAPGDAAPAATHKCSGCAPCCAAAAPAAEPVVLPRADLVSRVLGQHDEGCAAFVTAAPERPPRPLLA
jgi:hypothetical protein